MVKIPENVDRGLRRVGQMMSAFGQDIASAPAFPATGTVLLRYELLNEEYDELCHALICNDRVEVADALADILVITYGSALSFGGWDCLSADDEGCDIHCAVAEHNRAIVSGDVKKVLNGLRLVDKVVRELAVEWKIPLGEVFDEVMDSNMSKVREDGSVIYSESGKVLKPEGYFRPDVKGVLARYAEADSV